MTEQQLQSKIIKHLQSEGWLTIKTISLSTNGWPDVIGFKQGKTIFIEVKNPNRTNHATVLQKHRIEQLQSEGFQAAIVYNFDEFLSFFCSIT